MMTQDNRDAIKSIINAHVRECFRLGGVPGLPVVQHPGPAADAIIALFSPPSVLGEEEAREMLAKEVEEEGLYTSAEDIRIGLRMSRGERAAIRAIIKASGGREMRLYVQFSADGEHVRKWSREPFDGATAFKQAECTCFAREPEECACGGFDDCEVP